MLRLFFGAGAREEYLRFQQTKEVGPRILGQLKPGAARRRLREWLVEDEPRRCRWRSRLHSHRSSPALAPSRLDVCKGQRGGAGLSGLDPFAKGENVSDGLANRGRPCAVYGHDAGDWPIMF